MTVQLGLKSTIRYPVDEGGTWTTKCPAVAGPVEAQYCEMVPFW
ncbi:MAG: hypothetical protein ABSB97_07180 [Thermoplasmata archaeon]